MERMDESRKGLSVKYSSSHAENSGRMLRVMK